MQPRYLSLFISFVILNLPLYAQEKLETGSRQPMPLEWVDAATGHKIVRLSRVDGDNASFYFHNNPFISGPGGDVMIFYNTGANGKQLYAVNLKDFSTTQLTNSNIPKSGEIVALKHQRL